MPVRKARSIIPDQLRIKTTDCMKGNLPRKINYLRSDRSGSNFISSAIFDLFYISHQRRIELCSEALLLQQQPVCYFQLNLSVCNSTWNEKSGNNSCLSSDYPSRSWDAVPKIPCTVIREDTTGVCADFCSATIQSYGKQ